MSPEVHCVSTLAASLLTGVEVQTRAGLWGKPAATMGNARSKENERKSQELQPGSPQSKPQEKPGKWGMCFPSKHKVGTHSSGATGGEAVEHIAEGTSPRSALQLLD